MYAPFTSFVKEINDCCLSYDPKSAKFMYVSTSINVYCGWLSTKGIDFRQHIDPYCLHNVEMSDCDATGHGPPMTYASLTKPTEISDSAEIKSNIKIDENYLKGYHRYAWSFMINRVGLITGTWSKTISVLHLPASASMPEGNRCFKYRGGKSETESPPSSQWKLCCFTGHFQQGYVLKNNILAVTHSFIVLSANIALVKLIPSN